MRVSSEQSTTAVKILHCPLCGVPLLFCFSEIPRQHSRRLPAEIYALVVLQVSTETVCYGSGYGVEVI